jgi:hypothetical protein
MHPDHYSGPFCPYPGGLGGANNRVRGTRERSSQGDGAGMYGMQRRRRPATSQADRVLAANVMRYRLCVCLHAMRGDHDDRFAR